MAATATRRRGRKAPAAPTGKDTFEVWGTNADGVSVVLAEKGAAPHALVVAQRFAELAEDEAEFHVQRRSLFGPRAHLYRVARHEDGTVFTHTINHDD